jgi:hypothetical protein
MVSMKGQAWKENSPFHVALEFESQGEAQELREELIQWTPTGGWSEQAEKLFGLLSGKVHGEL